jgi:hypothetical protein
MKLISSRVMLTACLSWVVGSLAPHAYPQEDIDVPEPVLGATSSNPITTLPAYPPDAGTSWGPGAAESPVVSGWQGLTNAINTGVVPPDPHGAVGPHGIVQVINVNIVYWQKAANNGVGDPMWANVPLAQFVGITNNGGIADPKAVYDPGTQRFYVMFQENPQVGADQFHSFVHLAVSRNNNPTTSTAADWIFYRREMREVVDIGGGQFQFFGGDYPGIGFDAENLYITHNLYRLVLNPTTSRITFSGGPRRAQILVLPKAQLIGETLPVTLDRVLTPVNPASGAPTAFTLQPATVVGPDAPADVAYLAETALDSTTSVRVWALNHPGNPATRTLNNLPVTVPNHGGSAHIVSGGQIYLAAPQPPEVSGGSTFEYYLNVGVGARTMGEAFWYRGELWCCHAAGGATRSIVYYYRLGTNGYTGPTSGTPALIESGTIDGGGSQWFIYPSISCNSFGDVAITFTETSTATFPTIRYARRPFGAAGFNTPVTLVESNSPYTTSNTNGTISRWGDYSAVSVDPVDGSFWMTGEYALNRTVNRLTNQWATWWGQVLPYFAFQRIAPSASPTNVNAFVEVDNAGHYYLLSWNTAVSNRNMMLYKYDVNGALSGSWADVGQGVGVRVFDSTYSWDEPAAIVVDSAQNVYITGSGPGMVTAKYDSAGTLLWNRRFDPNNTNLGTGIDLTVDSSGNVYVCGAGALSLNSHGDNDAYIVKYDQNGNPSATWPDNGDGTGVRRYNHTTSTYSAYFGRCVLDGSGNLCLIGTVTNAAYTQSDYLIAKYTSTGVKDWSRVYNGGGADWGYDVGVDSAGAVFVTGESPSANGFDIVTLKCSASTGGTVWSKRTTTAGNHPDGGRVLKVAGNGDVYVGGDMNTAAAVVKYAGSNGTIQWQRTFAQGAYNAVYDIAINQAGDLLATGVANAISSSSNGFLLKYRASDGLPLFQTIYDRNGLVSATLGDHFVSIAVDSECNVYLGGRGTNPATNTSEIITVKYNAP